MTQHVGYGRVEEPWDVPIDQDLELDFRFWTGKGKATAATVTSATAYLREAGAASNVLEVDVGSGLTINGGTVALRVPRASVQALTPGTAYDFQLSVVANGSPRQVRASLRAIKGLS